MFFTFPCNAPLYSNLSKEIASKFPCLIVSTKMSGKLPPTSPLKNQPPAKRPNSANGNPITRGATAYNIESTYRRVGTLILKPLPAFTGKQLPSNSGLGIRRVPTK